LGGERWEERGGKSDCDCDCDGDGDGGRRMTIINLSPFFLFFVGGGTLGAGPGWMGKRVLFEKITEHFRRNSFLSLVERLH